MTRKVRAIEYSIKESQIENLLSTELFKMAKVDPAIWYWDKPISFFGGNMHIHLPNSSDINKEVKKIRQVLYQHFNITYDRIRTFIRHPRKGGSVMDVIVDLNKEEALMIYLFFKNKKRYVELEKRNRVTILEQLYEGL